MKFVVGLLLLSYSTLLLSANIRLISTYDGLKRAIEEAHAFDTILIEDNAHIDFTGEDAITISKPLILKSESIVSWFRPKFLNADKKTILIINAENVKIENINFEGNQTDSKKAEILAYNKKHRTSKGVYQYPVTKGIHVKGNGFSLKESEVSGFSHAGVFLEGAKNAIIENVHFHHNQRWGLGYGIALHLAATATIKNGEFDYNRHSIAGSGSIGQSYEVSYSTFGDNHLASPLDMHGGKDRADGTNIAGHSVYIHHNTILEDDHYIFIHRGVAQNKVTISHNKLMNTKKRSFVGYYNINKESIPKSKFIFRSNQIVFSLF